MDNDTIAHVEYIDEQGDDQAIDIDLNRETVSLYKLFGTANYAFTFIASERVIDELIAGLTLARTMIGNRR